MASEMKPFQIAVLAIFGVLALIGVIVFATFSSGAGKGNVGTVVIWGTLPQNVFDTTLNSLRSSQQGLDGVVYIEKNPATYDAELLNALAAGQGPDLIIITQDEILSKQDKIALIPFSSLSERTFRDTFIDESDLFLTKQGIVGLPFIVDPLVSYWNRNTLAASGVAHPPQYWDELYDYALKVTKRDPAGNITQSAVALGEVQNVSHAKDIFAAIMMQGGNSIVARAPETGLPISVFADHGSDGGIPAETTLTFFTQFADPNKNVYSWNRSLPASRDAFVGGQLALYFGYGSEASAIRTANPNLNFDIAALPKIKPVARSVALSGTFGRMHAFAVPKAARNSSGAIATAQLLSGAGAQEIANKIGLPSARRDLIALGTQNPLQATLYAGALVAGGWLDPNPGSTDTIVTTMVESVTTGKSRVSDAVTTAQRAFAALLPLR